MQTFLRAHNPLGPHLEIAKMLDALFGGIVSFVIKVAKPVAQAVIRAVLGELNITSSSMPSPRALSHTTRELDQEISDRERAAALSGRPMSQREADLVAELSRKKAEAFSQYEASKKAEAAEQLKRESDKFDTSLLSPGAEHKLQYHLGLVVLEKRCPTCGFPMKLQHKTVPDPTFADFFWQCTRFYVDDGRAPCRGAQFSARDINLLHRADTPELEIPKKDLVTIASEKSVQSDVVSRMRGHVGKPDEDVVCPVHLVPMILKEKANSSGGPLLDRYHLRCPHFQCSQTTKLKSYPQLAAYLRRQEGSGILH